MTRTRTRTGVTVGLLVAAGLVGGLLLTPIDQPNATFALLSDRTSVTATAGAGSLSLTVTPPASPDGVTLTRRSTALLTVSTAGALPWVLDAQVLDADGAQVECGEDGQELSLEAGTTGQQFLEVCGGDQEVATGTTPVTGLGVGLRWRHGEVTTPWAGTLRLTLQQVDGGFSDQVDVPLRLEGPAADAAPVEAVSEAPAEGAPAAERATPGVAATVPSAAAPSTSAGSGPAATPSGSTTSPAVTPAPPAPGSGSVPTPVLEPPTGESEPAAPEPAAPLPDADPAPGPSQPDAGA
ncbi:hypothetical protein [Modestobacter sp. Leaf380]|uniref:hypothetical protein n=1 Tax=Modestobacter sp. Leaf380 TaxID=1736356 RepID=UPI0006FC7001|nr:hypothetical protein [Modestobacter sp. Leaf380]KQS63612.1 hypothetical protein ASG41_18355 [Modestobacter sp. Leaf380]